MDIDVSKCKHYDIEDCPHGFSCLYNSDFNCYFKQLQQIKQENEELKIKLNQIKEITNNIFCKCYQTQKERVDCLECISNSILEIIERKK